MESGIKLQHFVPSLISRLNHRSHHRSHTSGSDSSTSGTFDSPELNLFQRRYESDLKNLSKILSTETEKSKEEEMFISGFTSGQQEDSPEENSFYDFLAGIDFNEPGNSNDQ